MGSPSNINKCNKNINWKLLLIAKVLQLKWSKLIFSFLEKIHVPLTYYDYENQNAIFFLYSIIYYTLLYNIQRNNTYSKMLTPITLKLKLKVLKT